METCHRGAGAHRDVPCVEAAWMPMRHRRPRVELHGCARWRRRGHALSRVPGQPSGGSEATGREISPLFHGVSLHNTYYAYLFGGRPPGRTIWSIEARGQQTGRRTGVGGLLCCSTCSVEYAYVVRASLVRRVCAWARCDPQRRATVLARGDRRAQLTDPKTRLAVQRRRLIGGDRLPDLECLVLLPRGHVGARCVGLV